ncbi:MAG TPA: hypothetical protein DCP69_12980 [Candidatus Omnitrophica bacterium]|nr:hypothetical protein [Candidatus Omnitrophota bacterium]
MLEVDAFLEANASGRKPYTTATARQYRYNLARVEGWLETTGLDPASLAPKDFRRFLSPTWGHSHAHLMLATLKAYLRWRYGETHPLLPLRLPRSESPVQRTLNTEEIDACFAVLRPTRRADRRTAALLQFALDTGLRSAELCNLRMDEIDWNHCRGQTRVKGGRYGPFIFSPDALALLLQWRADRDKLAPDSPYLFVSEDGLQLTREALRWVCWRLAVRAKIRRFSPHALRRAMACQLVENGASERMTAALGRWKNTQMVYTYTRALSLEAARDILPGAVRARRMQEAAQ